jgi:hypothetical protein
MKIVYEVKPEAEVTDHVWLEMVWGEEGRERKQGEE